MNEEIMPNLFIAVMFVLVAGVTYLIESRRKPTMTHGISGLLNDERLFIYWDIPSAKQLKEENPKRYQHLLEAWANIPPAEAWFQYNLSLIGVEPLGSSVRSAKRWYQKLWEKKQAPEAAYYLGVMQLIGLDKAPDYISAHSLLQKAGMGGIVNAVTAHSFMLLRDPLSNDWPFEDTSKAERHTSASICFQQAVEQGDMIASLNLGYCLEHGIGTKTDLRAAVESYLLAATTGLPAAQYRLSMIYEANGELADAYYWAYMASYFSGSSIAKARYQRLEKSLEKDILDNIQALAQLNILEIREPYMKAISKINLSPYAGV